MSEIISSVNNQTAKIKYYNDVNLFRGFAIFIIVWQHILMLIKFYGGVNWETHWQSIENLRSAFFDGGTSYFVFISGFFYALFYKRGFDYKVFIKNKLLKVFCPYFIISSIFVLYRATLVYYNIDDNFIFYSYLYWSFWYVPFIMVMFAISPIFINFIELNKRKKY